MNWQQLLFLLVVSWPSVVSSGSILILEGQEDLPFASETSEDLIADSAAAASHKDGAGTSMVDFADEDFEDAGAGPKLTDSLSDFSDLIINVSVRINDTRLEFDPRDVQRQILLIKRREERENCSEMADEEAKNPPYEENFCPRVWDKLLCWPPTLAGVEASLPCNLVPEFHRKGDSNATRTCDANGSWVGNSTPGGLVQGWTNYSSCIDTGIVITTGPISEWLPLIKKMSIVGYSVSLVTLVISFSILVSLKRLRCPRNILHLHLFASFILRASVVLFKSSMNLEETLPPNLVHLQPERDSSAGSWPCQLLITIWQYFILANYSWILMEGLYLHNLIFLALFSDSSAITMYIILGWGMPLLCVCTWAGLKIGFDNVHCWTVNNIQWIFWLCIRIPVALSNLLNFFFFLNVTRVLLLKLRSSISPESMKYRKLGKSTLVLVPLFGVHYFLLWGLSVSTNVTVELAWLLLDQVFASFQGFFVAVLYCLMNGEVRQELRKLFYRFSGDGMPELSYSTVISHTRSYFSRGRASIHSIHSTTDRRGDRQTPSPQMPRMGDCLSPTPRALTPTSGKLPEFYSINSSQPKLQDMLNNKQCPQTEVKESIELQTTSLVPISPNAGSSLQPRKLGSSNQWEESVPLIPEEESVRTEVQHNCSMTSPDEKRAKPLKSSASTTVVPMATGEIPTTVDKADREGENSPEVNGMVGHSKDLLVKVNSVGTSAQCSLLENEARQGESML